MKKVLLAVTTAVALAMTASATISISWFTNLGPTYQSDGTTVASGQIVQLIWSSNNSADALNPANPLVPTGDDILLLQTTTASSGPFNGGITVGAQAYDATQAPWNLTEDAFVPGYVYTRLFSDENGTGGIQAGDFYNDSALVGGPLNDQDPPGPSPNSMDPSNLAATVLDHHGNTPHGDPAHEQAQGKKGPCRHHPDHS